MAIMPKKNYQNRRIVGNSDDKIKSGKIQYILKPNVFANIGVIGIVDKAARETDHRTVKLTKSQICVQGCP